MEFLNINTGKSIYTVCIFDSCVNSGEFLRQRAHYFGIDRSTSPNVIHSHRTEHIDMDLTM